MKSFEPSKTQRCAAVWAHRLHRWAGAALLAAVAVSAVQAQTNTVPASGEASVVPTPAASAPVVVPNATPGATPTTVPAHGAAEHAEKSRRAHLRRLQERLDTPAEELKRSCRFESEISTLPPPGVVALTFDDGPEPGHTEAILATLAREGVPATFFPIADKAERYPALIERMRALPGAVVGNHTWSHPNFHDIAVTEQLQEIDRSDALLRADAAPAMLFRYPYGNSSCDANTRAHALGYRIVGWHVDSCDWAYAGPEGLTVREALSCGVLPAFRHDMVGHVLSGVRAHRGGIVLMHETHENTVQALDELIHRLKADGYVFTTPADPVFAASLR